jgi:hypothetical protein
MTNRDRVSKKAALDCRSENISEERYDQLREERVRAIVAGFRRHKRLRRALAVATMIECAGTLGCVVAVVTTSGLQQVLAYFAMAICIVCGILLNSERLYRRLLAFKIPLLADDDHNCSQRSSLEQPHLDETYQQTSSKKKAGNPQRKSRGTQQKRSRKPSTLGSVRRRSSSRTDPPRMGRSQTSES